MIRDRRPEDLEPLCSVLAGLDVVPAGQAARSWLEAVDAEVSWVFDQAPVGVAPTRNVIGHVQVWAGPPGELVVGRMFATPGSHRVGVARFLLREALSYVDRAGAAPVVDATVLVLVPASTLARHRLVEDRTKDGEVCARR